MSTGGSPESRQRAGDRTIRGLEVYGGKLVARFSDGSFHLVTPRARGGMDGAEHIELGCVHVTRAALFMVNEAVAEQDAFQEENCKKLMEKLKQPKRKKRMAPAGAR